MVKPTLYSLVLIITPIIGLVLICVGGTGGTLRIPISSRNITLIQSLPYVDHTNRFEAINGNETLIVFLKGAQLTLQSTARVTVYTCNAGLEWMLGSSETICGTSNRSNLMVILGSILLFVEVVLALDFWLTWRRTRYLCHSPV